MVDGSRKVVLTRSVGGAASDDHRFDATANELTYINAVGGSAQFEFHKVRAFTRAPPAGLQCGGGGSGGGGGASAPTFFSIIQYTHGPVCTCAAQCENSKCLESSNI